MKNSFIFYVLIITVSATLIFSLCGCGEAAEPEQPVMTEVYDDGSYTVDAGEARCVPDGKGGQCRVVRLHIANRTAQPLYISTFLCVRAECGGITLPCSVPDGMISCSDVLEIIDGRIAPQGFADGYIAIREPDGEEPVIISIAVDYCGGKWISFELPRVADATE